MNDDEEDIDGALQTIAATIELNLNGGADGNERTYVFILGIYPNIDNINSLEKDVFILTNGIETKNTIMLLESTVKLLKGQT